jgi:hypothetical protein
MRLFLSREQAEGGGAGTHSAYRKRGHAPGIPDYHRNRVPGGTFFFMVNLLDRRSDLVADQSPMPPLPRRD